MQIFERKKSIDINLGKFTMEEIMNFPNNKNVGSEEFYLKEIFNSNHIQIGVTQVKAYTSGIHDFEYDTQTKQIKIFSRFRNSAFLVYLYSILPLMPLIFGKNSGNILPLIGMTVACFIFFTLLLVFGIRSESNEIEREMVIRINYLSRNKVR